MIMQNERDRDPRSPTLRVKSRNRCRPQADRMTSGQYTRVLCQRRKGALLLRPQ